MSTNAYTHTATSIKSFDCLARAMAYAMGHEEVVKISFSLGVLDRDEEGWTLKRDKS